MSYVDTIIQPGESVLVAGKMHWIVFLNGLAFLIVGLALNLGIVGSNGFVAIVGTLLIIVGLAHLFGALVEKWTTEIVVTNKRVIHQRGLIRRATAEMNMDKVESVVVNQTILGRLLGYGSIVVRGTGAGIEGLHHIANPLGLRSAIVVR